MTERIAVSAFGAAAQTASANSQTSSGPMDDPKDPKEWWASAVDSMADQPLMAAIDASAALAIFLGEFKEEHGREPTQAESIEYFGADLENFKIAMSLHAAKSYKYEAGRHWDESQSLEDLIRFGPEIARLQAERVRIDYKKMESALNLAGYEGDTLEEGLQRIGFEEGEYETKRKNIDLFMKDMEELKKEAAPDGQKPGPSLPAPGSHIA